MNLERKRAIDREFRRRDRELHPDRYRLIDRLHYERRRATHPEHEKQRSTRWYRENPWRQPWLLWRNNRARARRYGIDVGSVSKEDLARLMALPCVRCGLLPAGGVDHRVALVRGGSNDLDNLDPCCLTCNFRKGSR